ncbi:MAG TPA: hypothetical protein ENJ30_10635 [Desulfobulbaceae bacterium]|nr:hypothetical protein [Desulfobulbaceae bacterium]
MRAIPRELYGTNVEWFNNGNGFWNVGEKRLDPVLVRLASEQHLSLIRFPGGTLSDYYQWKDGTGPRSLRPIRPHQTDSASSKNTFGSPELLSLCRSLGSSPLITVNVGTGSARSAADWVDYMNNPGNARRKQDGFPTPIPVRYWEIGNELYLNGTEAEKRITMTPERYAGTYLEFARLMKTVDPSIKLIALGVAGSYSVPFGPYGDWNSIVLQQAAAQIDLLALHDAYAPVLTQLDKNVSAEDVYKAMWSFPLAIKEDLDRVGNLLQLYEKKKQIDLAITEWGPFFSLTDKQFIDHVKTLGSAIYVARVLQVFLSQPRVRLANYFKFTDDSLMGWVSYLKRAKVPYYAFMMYSAYFGSELVQSSTESPTFSSKKIGLIESRDNIPEINVIASTNMEKNRLYVNIVSCSWDREYPVELDLHDVAVEKTAIKRSISGPSPFANNGPDLPPWWPAAYVEPTAKMDKPIAIETSTWNVGAPLIIPPHSITTIELTILTPPAKPSKLTVLSDE